MPQGGGTEALPLQQIAEDDRCLEAVSAFHLRCHMLEVPESLFGKLIGRLRFQQSRTVRSTPDPSETPRPCLSTGRKRQLSTGRSPLARTGVKI